MPAEIRNVAALWAEKQFDLRQLLLEDYYHVGELPIKGGWGYSLETAVVIDKHDPIVRHHKSFDGQSIQDVVVRKRIYEEMIHLREGEEWYSDFTWELQQKTRIYRAGRIFDYLVYKVFCCKDALTSYPVITARHTASNSGHLPAPVYRAYEKKPCHFTSEYYFDITSFASDSSSL